jgi:hypothetical protein
VFVGTLCSNASAGYGRAQRLCEWVGILSVFVGTLCSNASAGYGRARRLYEFVGRLCSTASAGHGRAQRLYEFLEALSPFAETLSLFLALGPTHSRGSTELPRVPRDLRPVHGELRRMLVSFSDDVGRISGHQQVEPARVSWRI